MPDPKTKKCERCGLYWPEDATHYIKNGGGRFGTICYNCRHPKDTRTAEQRTRDQLRISEVRREVQDLRERNRQLERMALTGEALRELAGSLGSPQVDPDPEWLRGAKQPRSVTGTAVLFLSDIHAGERVQRAQVGGANQYDLATMERRLHNTFRTAVVLLSEFMASPKFDGIVVPMGGDLFSGRIHEELNETNEEPIQRTMLRLEEILIEGLEGLARTFGKVHVPCVTGNHGRMTRKPQFKNRAFDNFEWLTYQRLAAYFKRDTRLTFDIPEGPDTYFRIYDKRFCLTHGDQFRGGDGVGGILVPIRRGLSRKQFRDSAMGSRWDVMLIGHWHQYHHMNDLVVNGSVKGADEYSYANNFAFEPPTQALFVVHPEVGVTARWPVFCDYAGGRAAKLK